MNNQSMDNNTMMKKRYFPSSFLVIIGLMVLFILASWVGYAVDSSRITGIGLLDVFTAIWRGFSDKVDIILFIFALGGTLGVMTKIKAIDAGIEAVVKKAGDKTLILIPVLMLIFGLGGTTYGMWEETIAFIPILLPVFKKAGYGSFTAILVILIGAISGVLASTINPFSVGAAVNAVNGTEEAILESDGFKDYIAANPNLINDTINANVEVTNDDQAGRFIINTDDFKEYYKELPGGKKYITTGALQGTRWVSFILFQILAISMVTWIATRYKKAFDNNFKTDAEAIEKAKSTGNVNGNFMSSFAYPFTTFFTRARVVEGLNEKLIESRFKEKQNIEFTTKRKISLALFISAFLLMILMYLPWGDFISKNDLAKSVNDYDDNFWWFASTSGAGYAKIGDWYFISVAALFLMVTIIIFAINFKDFKSKEENVEEGFINTYMSGVKDVVSVSLLIGVAGGLGEILTATGYGDLIAEESAQGLTNWIAFGVVIFIVSIILSLLVPSTSGFAAAFIPIFTALAIKAFPNDSKTAVGIAILGFIFANGLANIVTPTSAVLMGYTQYAGIPYHVWLKQVWKIVLAMFVLSLFLVIVFSAAAADGSSLF